MITAEYLITGKYGELQRVSGDGRLVCFKLGEEATGILSLGGRRAELTDGCCTVSIHGLVRGRYTPMLITPEGTLELEPISVLGERIAPAPTTEKMHRYALERIRALESKIKILEERINELQSAISGTALFK